MPDFTEQLALETISEIFSYCLPDESDDIPEESAPLLLCHVCQRWRTIALNQPLLWNNPTFSTPMLYFSEEDEVFRKRWDSFLDRVMFWITNSGSSPLSISLTVEPSCPDEDGLLKNEFERLTSIILLAQLHRLVNLSLGVYGGSTLWNDHLIGLLPRPSFSVLHTIHFDFRSPGVDFPTSFFRNASSLKRLVLDNMGGSLIPLNKIVDEAWTRRLTEIAIGNITPLQFSEALQLVSSLETFISTVSLGGTNSHPIAQQITASNLHTLSLTLDETATLSFLNCITFPSLNELRLYNITKAMRDVLYILPEDIVSQPFYSQLRNLTSLTLGDQILGAKTLISLFRQTPHLKQLKLDSEVGDYHLFMDALICRENTPDQNLIPLLEDFSLMVEVGAGKTSSSFEPSIAFNAQDFIDLVLFRCIKSTSFGKLRRMTLLIEKVGPQSAFINIDDLGEQVGQLDLGGTQVKVVPFDIGDEKVYFAEPVKRF